MPRLLLLLPTLLSLALVGVWLPATTQADSTASGRRLITPAVKVAVEEGTRFLVSLQKPDGAWPSNAGKKINETYKIFPNGTNVSHVGVTGLAVLSLLAGGHLPGRGPYGAHMERAVDYLLSQMNDQGYIAGEGTRMYSHAMATLALAELYGMSRRTELKPKLELAIKFTASCQNDTGGWRYVPFARDSDMSVTVCQIVALRAARNVGIRVPQATIDRALGYILRSAISSQDRGGPAGAYWYQPHDQRFNRDSFALAAAGLTALFQAGLYQDRQVRAYLDAGSVGRDTPPPRISQSLSYMEREYRNEYRNNPDHYFYFYGNYYAAQAMYQIAGRDPQRWRRWYSTVRDDMLARRQRGRNEQGQPITWWRSNVDSTNAYATACALLVLQFPLDHLPIHQR